MSDITHTPGPWRVLECRGKHEIRIGYGSIGNWLASVWMDEDVEADPEAEADARLIAAAPTMLAALEELFVQGEVQCLLAGNPNACEALEAKCRAAIAKARGHA